MSTIAKRTQRLIQLIEDHFPLGLADDSWDNVGLLIDHSSPTETMGESEPYKILLTNDYNKQVSISAFDTFNPHFIWCYHPTIFIPLRKICYEHHLTAIKNNSAIYCPHTAMDNAKINGYGGPNDFLAKAILNTSSNVDFDPVYVDMDRSMAQVGRIVSTSLLMEDVIDRVKEYCDIDKVKVWRRPEHSSGTTISKLAICVGSGSSVFNKLTRSQKIDVLVTGEMQYHDCLKFYHQYKCSIILTGHAKSERPYLAYFKKFLTEKIEPNLGFSLDIEIANDEDVEISEYI